MATGIRIGSLYVCKNIASYVAVSQLADIMNYRVEQINGQRIFGPPLFYTGPVPTNNCEIFVGNIPRFCYEDQLIPLFEKAGPIYQFRLMIDFAGYNRGFAFIKYINVADASRAITLFHNKPVGINYSGAARILAVMKTHNNNTIYLGRIAEFTEEQIIETIKDYLINIEFMTISVCDSENAREIYLHFYNHAAAALSRRTMLERNYEMWSSTGKRVIVDWASRHEPTLPVCGTVTFRPNGEIVFKRFIPSLR